MARECGNSGPRSEKGLEVAYVNENRKDHIQGQRDSSAAATWMEKADETIQRRHETGTEQIDKKDSLQSGVHSIRYSWPLWA